MRYGWLVGERVRYGIILHIVVEPPRFCVEECATTGATAVSRRMGTLRHADDFPFFARAVVQCSTFSAFVVTTAVVHLLACMLHAAWPGGAKLEALKIDRMGYWP